MNEYNIGDVIQLNGRDLTKGKARFIAFKGHNFIIVDKNGENIKVISTTSDDKLANAEKTVSVVVNKHQDGFDFDKPVTYALLTTQGTVPESYVRKKLGKLVADDLTKIQNIFKNQEINVRQVIERFKIEK